MNFKSKLIERIVGLNLDYIYHRQSLLKGYNYYKERVVLSMYSPRYEELIAYVQGTDVYCVHLYLRGNSLVNNCTCPVSQNCKHVIACLYEIRNDYSLYDNDTSINNNNVKLYKDPTFEELFELLNRLVGPKFMLNYYVDGDFRIYYRKLLEKIKFEIRVGNENSISHFGMFVGFVSKITYHSSANFKLDLAKDIYPIVEELILSENKQLIDELTKIALASGAEILIDCLSRFEEEHMASNFTTSVIDKIISLAQESSGNVSDKVNIMIANNYLLNNQIKFRQFARKNITISKIRQMLAQSLFYDKAYDEICDIYLQNKPETQKEYALYLSSLVELKRDHSDVIKDFLSKYTSVENIKILESLGIKKESIENYIIDYIDSIPDEKMRINTMISFGYKDKIFDLLKRLRPIEALNMIHDNFKVLVKSNTDEIFLFYQECIVKCFNEIQRRYHDYFKDFNSLPFSLLYKIQLTNELANCNKIDDTTCRWMISYITSTGDISS